MESGLKTLYLLHLRGSNLREGQVISVAIVRIRDGEAFEQAFRRFKKSCEKAGILTELKKREHFEKPSVRKKKKSIAARKRANKKVRRPFVKESF